MMLKIKSVNFYKSYSDYKKIPNSKFLEIAFIGRSNVGKSSLINNLCNKKIADTSSTPGKTQLINYFTINESLYFVDLPGYGFAKTSKLKKKSWPLLIEPYLQNREQLKIIIFLLDIRRIPNEYDKMLNQWIKSLNDVNAIYVLTKYDKLSKNLANNNKIKIALELFVDQSDFIFYSVTKNIGKKELLKQIEESMQEIGVRNQ